MLKKRSKLAHGMKLIASAGPGLVHLIKGLWQGGNRALVPLVIFLVLMGMVLVFGASVEALAPFIYTIF